MALWIEGWVLSPVPPSVYLPLPAGLLGEQEMGNGRGDVRVGEGDSRIEE